MRWIRLLLVVLAVVAIAGPAFAQTDTSYIGCVDLAKSLVDTIQTVTFTGRPGDTVMMPLLLVNSQDCFSFQFLIKYDTTKLTPIFVRDSICDQVDSVTSECTHYAIDTTYIDFAVTGRFLRTITNDITQEVDTITKFQANLLAGQRNVVSCSFLPSLNEIDSIPDGRGVIYYIKFKVKPGLLHNTTAAFSFYESDIFTIALDQFGQPDTTFYDGCTESQMAVTRETNQIYPSHSAANGVFRVDTNSVPTPIISSFTANPTQISQGSYSTLSWTVVNSDSIVIFGSGVRVSASSALTGQIPVYPTTTTAYTLTAYKATKTVSSSPVTVTVGGGGGTGPVLSFNPSQSSYSIKQGETVSFTVTATGTTGQTITLSAGSVPNNGTFAPSNPVIGNTTATGTFSFTPDFNQKGLFAVTFAGSSSTGTTTSSVSIIVTELEKDRLFSTSTLTQKAGGRDARGERDQVPDQPDFREDRLRREF